MFGAAGGFGLEVEKPRGSAQVRFGVGASVHYEDDSRSYDDPALPAIMLGFGLETNRFTMGHVMEKETGSIWYWVPLMPRSEIDFNTLFLLGGSGIVTQTRGRVEIIRHVSVVFDYFDGPNSHPYGSVWVKINPLSP